MLMSIDCSIIQNLKVRLTFDNNQVKEREIAVGDLVYVEFNENGKRRAIEGKVLKIGLSNTTNTNSWYVIVDGSLDFSGERVRFNPNQILDLDIIQKHDSVLYVSTPNDSTRVNAIRIYDGILQVSVDNGYSWITPNANNQIQEEEGSTGDDNQSVPPCPNKPDKLDAILKVIKSMNSRIDGLQNQIDDFHATDLENNGEGISDEDFILDEVY